MELGWLALLPVAASLAITVGACGAAPRASSGAGQRKGDESSLEVGTTGEPSADRPADVDSWRVSGLDKDDRLAGESPAPLGARSAIVAVVRRYYAAAAERNGRIACSLLIASQARAVPEDYGRPPGPPSLSGHTCAAVLSKLFAQHGRELAEKSSSLDVGAVLVGHGAGSVYMRFGKAAAERSMFVQREDGVWKIVSLLDTAVL